MKSKEDSVNSDLPSTSIWFRSPDDIAKHPRYESARNIYIQEHTGLYNREILANRVLIEATRIVLFTMVICQHASFDLDRRETWLTMGRLREGMVQWGLGSPRQIETLVARLVQMGYLKQQPCLIDRRVKLLEPTTKMLAHDQAWLKIYYAPLDHLYPDGPYGLAMRGDPDFQLAQRRVAFSHSDHGAQMMKSHPATMLFLMRSSGQIILLELLKAVQARPPGGAGEAFYTALAERCGVSRTHVRTLLEEAEAAGLVRLSGRGGLQVEILPPLWADFDRFNAESMSIHDLICRQALAAMGRPF